MRGVVAPAPHSSFLEGYLSRSLALPSLSLAVPFVWSERPSAFFSLSPVTAPVASLALPLALSSAPSPLSWLLLFLPTCSFSLLRLSRSNYILQLPRTLILGCPHSPGQRARITSPARSRLNFSHHAVLAAYFYPPDITSGEIPLSGGRSGCVLPDIFSGDIPPLGRSSWKFSLRWRSSLPWSSSLP